MICRICKIEKELKDFNWKIKDKKIKQNYCKECQKILNKKYQSLEKNIKKRKEYDKKYYLLNKDKKKENAEKYKVRRNKIRRERRLKDIQFKLKDNLRRRINQAIKLKSNSSKDLLGCSIKKLKEYLEGQFQDGMSWNNYGRDGWHIDHIKPCTSFNLINEDEQKKCFHYTNLQPLWAEDNLKKSNKIL